MSNTKPIAMGEGTNQVALVGKPLTCLCLGTKMAPGALIRMAKPLVGLRSVKVLISAIWNSVAGAGGQCVLKRVTEWRVAGHLRRRTDLVVCRERKERGGGFM